MEIVKETRESWRTWIAGQAEKALAQHELREVHRSKEIARWLCRRPGTWNYGFNVVAWPGAVVIQGDVGCAVYKMQEGSVDGVLAWLRGSVNDPTYLTEKMQGAREKNDRVLIWPWVEQSLAEMETEDAVRFREEWADQGCEDGDDYGRLLFELFGDAEAGCEDLGHRPLWLAACLRRFVELLDLDVRTVVTPGAAP